MYSMYYAAITLSTDDFSSPSIFLKTRDLSELHILDVQTTLFYMSKLYSL